MDVLSLPQSEQPVAASHLMDAPVKLPVFWDLNGKQVLVASCSDAAALKAELLAACGAQVHVYLCGQEPRAT